MEKTYPLVVLNLPKIGVSRMVRVALETDFAKNTNIPDTLAQFGAGGGLGNRFSPWG